MKSYKNALCLSLVFALLFTLLSGCGSESDNSASSATSDISADSASGNISADTSAKDDSVGGTAFSYSDGINESGYMEGIKALDYVELFDYKALSIPIDKHQVSEDDVQAEIDNMLSYFQSSEQITDRVVADGDTVNIDYVGSVDGVEFDGGSTAGAGTDVTIGVTSYIDDFLEQLIGHKPGETINVEVTFPDDYHETSLQGKDAVFITTINYIAQAVPAELTDDFVATNLSTNYGWETVTEMKEEMYSELQKAAVQQYINDCLTNEVDVRSIPDKLAEYQEEAMVQYYRESAEYYSMEFEEFIDQYMGVASVEELIELNRDNNLQNATYVLAIQAVAEDAEISVSEEDMANYLNDYSSYEEQYGRPYLTQIVLIQKVIDYIAVNAVLE